MIQIIPIVAAIIFALFAIPLIVLILTKKAKPAHKWLFVIGGALVLLAAVLVTMIFPAAMQQVNQYTRGEVIGHPGFSKSDLYKILPWIIVLYIASILSIVSGIILFIREHRAKKQQNPNPPQI